MIYIIGRITNKNIKFLHDFVQVHLIDHGISFSAKIDFIFDFDDTLLQRRIDRVPDLAIECYLNKIQPIVDCDNIGGRWSDDAIKLFSSYKNRRVKAKVFYGINYEKLKSGNYYSDFVIE